MPRLERITVGQARLLYGFDDLLALNWEEVEGDDHAPISVNWAAYHDLERRDVLHFYALLQGNQMLGYAVYFVQPTLHHRTVWAINDLIYLDPEHRRGLAGANLIKGCEKLLKAAGAKLIVYNVKPSRDRRDLGYKRGRDSVARLLQKLGYSLDEEAWAKRI